MKITEWRAFTRVHSVFSRDHSMKITEWWALGGGYFLMGLGCFLTRVLGWGFYCGRPFVIQVRIILLVV